MSKRILITGHTSFAAQGLVSNLIADGHTVDCFSRRNVFVADGVQVVTGEADCIDQADGLAEHYDVILNYLIVKNGDIADNEAYLKSLLRLCKDRRVEHLIHISSISVFPASATKIDESTPIETEPSKKGSYGSLKVAADLYIDRHLPSETKVSFVRPGFILAPGLSDPIVGMAFRTPYNRLLLLGRSSNTVPLTFRDDVHQVVQSLAAQSDTDIADRHAWIVVDPDSPSRLEYLTTLCKEMGYGEGVFRFPSWLWKLAGAGGNVVAMLVGMKLRPYKILSAACRRQTFDSSKTSRKLGVDFRTDWPALMKRSLEGQESTYRIPEPVGMIKPPIQSIGYFGWGRIVKQKHLPALSKLGIQPRIDAYDLGERNDEGQAVHDINGTIADAEMFVVATPGPVHADAMKQIPNDVAPVLVEKPLSYHSDEYDLWLEYARLRTGPVSICHNYRFKSNVQEMLQYLNQYNPGELRHVSLQFQSPPVANESAVWLRNERKARTLLMDYGIHFLDLACMFSEGSIKLETIRHEENERGETSLIQGSASCADHSLSFLIRQGSIPRKCIIRYVFHNYEIRLSFFPDTFAADMSGESGVVLKRTAKRISRAVRTKIIDKLTSRDSDQSHALALSAAYQGNDQLSVSSLAEFYAFVFDVADQVYGESKRGLTGAVAGEAESAN